MQPSFDFFSSARTADLRFIKDRLLAQFGLCRDQGDNPLDQFVCCILGSITKDEVSLVAYERLVQRYPSWDMVADSPEPEIQKVIGGVTLPEAKAATLKLALQTIRKHAGSMTLDFLNGRSVAEALAFLEAIPGIGRKTAAAALNFSSLRMRTFVVDTHVLRVLQRFGFVDEKASADDTYDAVMTAVDSFDADDLYELHWHIKRLGQTLCTHARAFCETCPLREHCVRRIEPGAIMVSLRSAAAA